MKTLRLPDSIQNLTWFSASELIARAVSLIYLLLLARYLHPVEFGEFNLYTTYFALAVVLGNVGTDRVVLRDVATGTAPPYAVSTLLATRTVTAIGAGAVLVMAGILLNSSALGHLWIIAVGMIPAGLSVILTAANHARERFGVPAAALMASTLTMIVLTGIGIGVQAPLRYFVTTFVASEVVRCGWLLINTTGVYHRRPMVDMRYMGRALRAALPFGVLSFLGIIYLRIDLLMLDSMGSGLAVAEYAAAYRIVDALVLIPALILGVLFPRIARLQSTDVDAAGRIYLLSTRMMLWLGLTLALGGAIFARPLLTALFGTQYADAADTFRFLMLALVFVFWHAPNGMMLFASTRLRVVIVLSVLFVGLNVAANLILIPPFGAPGAAAATAISEALAVLAFSVVVCRRLNIRAPQYAAGIRNPYVRRRDLQALAVTDNPVEPRTSLEPAPARP